MEFLEGRQIQDTIATIQPKDICLQFLLAPVGSGFLDCPAAARPGPVKRTAAAPQGGTHHGKPLHLCGFFWNIPPCLGKWTA